MCFVSEDRNKTNQSYLCSIQKLLNLTLISGGYRKTFNVLVPSCPQFCTGCSLAHQIFFMQLAQVVFYTSYLWSWKCREWSIWLRIWVSFSKKFTSNLLLLCPSYCANPEEEEPWHLLLLLSLKSVISLIWAPLICSQIRLSGLGRS